MLLTLLNFTDENISCRCVSKRSSVAQPEILLAPSTPRTIDCTKPGELELLPRSATGRTPDGGSKEWLVKPEESSIRISLALGALWRVVHVPDGCPWRIYLSKITKRHHRLFVFPQRNLASFLSEMPDTLPLSSLCLPGTHET
ncbi:hypothetical protein FPV67DRAFT_289811 [Lyophyllum atratum]|nr:hypothetical protein FPV67DRAFT_289811 [Lyophyllum atratum]